MADIYNLRKLKEKKHIKKDVENLINVFSLNIKGLQQYSHYIPVKNVLNVISEEIKILKYHLNEINEYIAKKGKEE